MAFLQIINDTNFIEVITNDYAPYVDTHELYILKTQISYISLSANQDYVELGLTTGKKYQFTYSYPPSSPNLLVVDSVDGIAAIDNDDLLHKIKDLV